MKLVIVAGGTGGHVFPALAVVEAFKTLPTKTLSSEIVIDWLGTDKGIEAQVVPAAGLPLHFINVKGIRGKGLQARVLGLVALCSGLIQSLHWLRRLKPDVVLGMGGYVSGPVGLAAWLLRIPVVIHEQNARMGLTNRLLTRLAKRIFWGLPNPAESVCAHKSVRVGNPIRAALADVPDPQQRFDQRGYQPGRSRRLLVLGGSLGAKALNDALPSVMAELPKDISVEIVHQTGAKHVQATVQAYQQLGIAEVTLSDNRPKALSDDAPKVSVEVVAFVEDMAARYQWADLVVCRAGALTVSELALVGVGAILIPYPYAVDDHQTHNAEALVAIGAADLIQEGEDFSSRLAERVYDGLQVHPDKLLWRAQQARHIATPNAANDIVRGLLELAVDAS